MEVIQRFPKWLTEEKFDLHFDPQQVHAYTVAVYNKNGSACMACADTIGQAAKQADELRQKSVI